MADQLSGKVLQACDSTHPGAVALGDQTLGSGTKTVDALTSSQFQELSSYPSAAVSPSGSVRLRSNDGVLELSYGGGAYMVLDVQSIMAHAQAQIVHVLAEQTIFPFVYVDGTEVLDVGGAGDPSGIHKVAVSADGPLTITGSVTHPSVTHLVELSITNTGAYPLLFNVPADLLTKATLYLHPNQTVSFINFGTIWSEMWRSSPLPGTVRYDAGLVYYDGATDAWLAVP